MKITSLTFEEMMSNHKQRRTSALVKECQETNLELKTSLGWGWIRESSANQANWHISHLLKTARKKITL